MPGSSPVLEVSGLTKDFCDFWGRPFIRAVSGLDLRLEKGEVFGLLGPNGSGKTTTIKMLLGLLEPTAGTVSIFGAPPSEPAVRRRIGYVPEENILFRHQRCADELRLAGRFYGLSGRRLEERIEELLRLVGIFPARGRLLREFSKGMGRRHALARALLGDPELIILDEPTSGLDPIGVREVKNLIIDLKDQGKTILLSSHLLADVEEVCDRAAIMRLGEKVVEGPLSELLAAPEGSLISSDEVPFHTALEKKRELEALLGGRLSVGPKRMRLEDIFISTVRRRRNERGGD